MLLLRFSGSFLLRHDARTFAGLLFQDPPRSFSASSPQGDSRQKKSPGGYAAKEKRNGKEKRAKGTNSPDTGTRGR